MHDRRHMTDDCWGGGRRSPTGRIPIGQKKSVFRSVGSKNLRAGGSVGEEEEVEGIEVEEDVGEETSEENTKVEVEEVDDEHSYLSSSSSKTIEDRSIGGRAALLKQKFSQQTGFSAKKHFLPFLPRSTPLVKMGVSFEAIYSFAIMKKIGSGLNAVLFWWMKQ